MANYNVKVDNIEKPVTDLNKKFDNITKEFKTVRDKLRDNKEELTRRRQENLEAKTQLTKIKIFTNNYPIIVFVNAWNYMKYQLQSSTKTSGEKVCQILPLVWVSTKKDYITQCHRLKMKTQVIMKLKERQQRYNIIFNINKLKEMVLRTRYLWMKV